MLERVSLCRKAAMSSLSSLSPKEKMLQARALIQQKRLEEARAILITVDHPVAWKWLDQIDVLREKQNVNGFASSASKPVQAKLPSNEPQRKLSTANPWNPTDLMTYNFFATPFIAGVLLGYNWRRFGKEGWMWPSIGLALLFPLTIVLMLGILIQFDALNVQYAALLLIGLSLMGTWAFNFWMFSLQSDAYRTWKRSENPAALVDYPFNYRKAWLGVGGVVLVGVLLVTSAGVMVHNELSPVVLDHKDLTMTTTSQWNQRNVSRAEGCLTGQFECIFELERQGYVLFSLVRYPVAPGTTPEQIEESKRPSYLRDFPLDSIIGLASTTVDGYPAFIRDALSPRDRSDQCPDYVRQVYIVNGNQGYQVTITASCQRVFNESVAELEAMVASIHFKNTGSGAMIGLPELNSVH